MRIERWWSPWTLLLTLAACRPPADETPLIAVSPGIAGRFDVWARVRHQPPARARARVLRAGEELAGGAAAGRVGDAVLENGRVIFVVAAVAGSAADGGRVSERSGALIDAADAARREDRLVGVDTTLDDERTRATAMTLSLDNHPDGSATVSVFGVARRAGNALEVTTDYHLEASEVALAVVTTVTNAGPGSTVVGPLRDAVEGGGVAITPRGEREARTVLTRAASVSCERRVRLVEEE